MMNLYRANDRRNRLANQIPDCGSQVPVAPRDQLEIDKSRAFAKCRSLRQVPRRTRLIVIDLEGLGSITFWRTQGAISGGRKVAVLTFP